MHIKPHFLLILLHTLKLAFAVLIFYAGAVIFSPDRYYTALNGLKVFILLFIIVYVYYFYFWQSTQFLFTEEKLVFTNKAGRKNNIEISFSAIEKYHAAQPFLYKTLGLSKIILQVKGMSMQTGSDLSVLENYLVFKTSDAEKILSIISQNKEENSNEL